MANATPDSSRYIALTTYRRDGRAVTTPVWAVAIKGKFYVVTTKSTGKAKRVRATGRVRFAACNMNGRRILGEWQEGTGRIVQNEARRSEALAALQRKYGWQLSGDAGLPTAGVLSRARGAGTDAVARDLTVARSGASRLTWQHQARLLKREV